jgi:hypothetical protein
MLLDDAPGLRVELPEFQMMDFRDVVIVGVITTFLDELYCPFFPILRRPHFFSESLMGNKVF